MSSTLRELHSDVTTVLSGVVEFPRREAELLLMAYLECNQLYFITHQDEIIDENDSKVDGLDRKAFA